MFGYPLSAIAFTQPVFLLIAFTVQLSGPSFGEGANSKNVTSTSAHLPLKFLIFNLFSELFRLS